MALTWKVHFNIIALVALPALLLHVLGFCLLLHFKQKIGNQVYMMVNLAATEILFCLTIFAESLSYLLVIRLHVVNYSAMKIVFNYLSDGFYIFATTANKMVMIYFVIDRFFEVYLHMRYTAVFSTKRVRYTLACIWISSATYGLTYGLCIAYVPYRGTRTLLADVHTILSILLDGTFIIAAISVYSYFYIKARKFKTSEKSVRRRKTSTASSRLSFDRFSIRNAKFNIPMLIVFSYLLFNRLPSTLYIIWKNATNNIQQQPVLLLVSLLTGFVFNSILHVFIQKRVRALIVTFFSAIFKSRSQNKVTENYRRETASDQNDSNNN